jgi:hypothetical protein
MKSTINKDCPKCGRKDSVSVIFTEYKDSGSVEVLKCTKCRYESGIKELFGAKIIPAPLEREWDT